MTLNLTERQKYFIEANNAINIYDAIEKFSSKLGEFYGVLHKSNIGYHHGFSEHCTLADITISGIIMDIGGLTQQNKINNTFEPDILKIKKYIEESLKKLDSNNDTIIEADSIPAPLNSENISEAYTSPITKTINLIKYLCRNVLKTDEYTLENSLNTFWNKYKNLYTDTNVEFLYKNKKITEPTNKIRTKYLNNNSGEWITLAPDLKDLSYPN